MPCRCPLMSAAPLLAVALVAGAAFTAGLAQPSKPAAPAASQPAKPAAAPKEDAYVLGFKMKRIDGTEEDLSTYKGKVVVMVNVASKCGYTGQYKALEDLYKAHKDHGLVILGFPANNFNSQEPGTNKDIAEFCKSTYDVSFPMFEKISVKGDDQHALYKKLAAQPKPIGGDPKWNFTKFVVNKEGNVVARFDAKGDGKSRTALEPDLVKKIEELLGVGSDSGKKDEKTPPPAGS